MGATGSVGNSTLDVISRNPSRFEVFALTANTNVEALSALVRRHQPRFAVMGDEASARLLVDGLGSVCRTEILAGPDALVHVASHPDCDAVMAGIVGGAGLPSSFAAAEAGKRVLLANKEALVMSGALFMQAVANNGADLLPVDSEHNAMFQALGNSRATGSEVSRLLLTGSGGPLLRIPLEHLAAVTPDEACAHPNWNMGRKISVDSATMMNKGLELIEACWLFRVPVDRIEVVIHPTSIVHSMVEYVDGSVVAQLGSPDMRTPIANALAWPERVASGAAPLDFSRLAPLAFEPVDLSRFPCLRLAMQAANADPSAPVVLNAANEIAVASFLDELIGFTDIERVIGDTLDRVDARSIGTIDDVLALDSEARRVATQQMRDCAALQESRS